MLLLGPDLVRGQPLPLVFDVLPQRQVIYMRALPAFDDALAEFGLLAEKEAVKARIGDNPGWLMDSGSYRPFEERAELDGQGPSFFGPESRAYLERILPAF